MSASSSAASSTITRSRVGVAACILTAVVSLYYLNSIYCNPGESVDTGDTDAPAPPLRRSNAIHRNRRRSQRTTDTENASMDRPRTVEEYFREEEDNDRPSAQPIRDELPSLDLETVVDDDVDEWAQDDSTLSRRNGQNVVQLLFRVSEEATRQSSYVHRGCHCDACGTVPIRGIRYRCSNCADYDLCEACEAQQLHTKTHIFYKIRVPAYSFSSRQSQPPCYPGQPDTALSQLPKALITKMSKETGFERQEIYAYWEQFTFMANTEWRDDPDGLCLAMDRVTFDQCLVPSGGWRNIAPSLIFDRMFAFYDTNHDGLISFPEFLNGLAFRKKKDKLKKIFEGYDLDGDGYVDRKDFLRMFRSYYTMYKAIHEDLLESLHDHTMSRTEAQQLISGRQPLSSMFSREVPISGGGAQDARSGEGKAALNGELEVVDGRGAVNESGKDHGEREDVIIDAVVREHARRQEYELASRRPASLEMVFHMPSLTETSFAPDSQVRDAHWEAMMDPPSTIDQLQHNLLDNLIQSRQDRMEARQSQSMIPTAVALRLRELGTSAEDSEIRQELLAGAFNVSNWPPEYVDYEDVEAVCGETMPMVEVAANDIFDIVKHALRRRRQRNLEKQTIAAKNALNERWKRRQFYTDEEEGVTQPDYYDIDEEISEDARVPGGIIHTAASSPRPVLSPRSRSSSKVRFAEDTDDFDIRSNPSTSSRSVPERWGGMDIPEAEKDAGKDILYQVTQHAFNELLDPLFKKREDMAMNVMATKKERDVYRHLFTTPEFEKWATEVDHKAILKLESGEVNNPFQEMEAGIREGNEYGYSDEEIDSIRDQPLEELLAASRYQIISTPQSEEHEDVDDLDELDDVAHAHPDEEPTFPDEDHEIQAEIFESNNNGEVAQEESHLDPTLPQNRPNSITTPTTTSPLSSSSTTTPIPRARFSKTFDENYVPETVAPWSPHSPHLSLSVSHNNPPNTTYPFPTSSKSKGKEKEIVGPSRSRLYLLRCHEKYEVMAKEMGGWGRLDFREWERIVKGRDGKGRSDKGGNTGFEYLGGWIDICIP